MKYTKKRVQLELSQKQLDYLQTIADKADETVNDVIKDFFYTYLQDRMQDNEITVLPIW